MLKTIKMNFAYAFIMIANGGIGSPELLLTASDRWLDAYYREEGT
jgi:hypothetical protein